MLVVDGFIKNQKILNELKKDHHWSNMPAYSWWDGWWTIKPRNIWETAIELIWKQLLKPEDKICGFEYWATKLEKNGEVKLHHDKDEKLIRKEKKLACATVGHIFYVDTKNLKGGYLEMAPDQNIDEVGKLKKTYTYDEHTERIKPVENRLVIHNPLRLHGVSKVKEGVRKAFLANAWTKKPSTFDAGENVNGSFEFVNWKEKNKAFNI